MQHKKKARRPGRGKRAVKKQHVTSMPEAGFEVKAVCQLCGAAAHSMGIFFPADGGRSLGAPEGKVRAVAYFLCNDCEGLPEVRQQVEFAVYRNALGLEECGVRQ